MKRKKVWRYYCDFCKKSGCSGGHMKEHEQHCTMNPDRTCRMCDLLEEEQAETQTLVDALLNGGMKRLRTHTICPACLLAAIRQSGIFDNEHFQDPRRIDIEDNFDYKAEKKEVMDAINDAALAREGYHY